VGSILRSYQRGHQRLWQLWQQRIEESIPDAESRAAVIALGAEVLLEYVTVGMELTVHTHAVEREIRLRGASWRQRDDVLALLEGRSPDTEAELSRRLGHPWQRGHVAFVCWSGTGFASRDVGGLEASAREWAEAAAGAVPLLVPVDSGTTWGWVSAPTGTAWLDDDLPAPRPGFRIATGTAAAGLAGFRRSHAEALRAQVIAAAAAEPAPVTRYVDIATLAVLTDDQDALRRYVDGQLGDLALPGEREHRLRTTVRNYLDGGANVRAVARELNYHRNTIQQRLELAAKLRGRPLDDDRSGLALALVVAEHYGDAVLRTERTGS
jgi:DNA-binding PucR family transcriptional regulator